jgi:hypothetical protein
VARSLPWTRHGRSTDGGEHTALAEAVTSNAVMPPPRGYVEAIPRGGTRANQPGDFGGTTRREFAGQLYQAYLSCPWSSACVDTVARTITAGGLKLVPDTDDDEGDKPTPAPTRDVLRMQSLLDRVNPREDIRQLYRGLLTDAQVFGDGFWEVVWYAGQPVALYSLDSPTMIPIADEHGTITGYTQVLDTGRTAMFEPHEVIQVSLDSPRGGVYGVGPTQKNLLAITTWIFTEALLKETMRKGNPPRLAVDFPIESADTDAEIWAQKYAVRNLGISNLGTPILSRGGVLIKEMQVDRIAEYLATLANQRDLILSGYGVPPSKVGVIESGNLGGGTGTSQDKTFRVNTCGPYDELALEKFNFNLTRVGFGIEGWKLRSGEVDWRDDKIVDDISSQRLRDGRWTLNRSRVAIGEPPVDGGDTPIFVERQLMMAWSDLDAYSAALITSLQAASAVPAAPAPVAAVPVAKPSKESLERYALLRGAALRDLTEHAAARTPVAEAVAAVAPAIYLTVDAPITVEAAPAPNITVESGPAAEVHNHFDSPVINVEAAPTPNVTIDAPITVEAAPAPSVTVEPAVVNIAAPVTVTAPSVTVEPAVVNVAAPIVNIPAPEAPKKSTATRNADGSVTVTTEPS